MSQGVSRAGHGRRHESRVDLDVQAGLGPSWSTFLLRSVDCALPDMEAVPTVHALVEMVAYALPTSASAREAPGYAW
jgi:hypothetical protein